MIGGIVVCRQAGITYRQLDYWITCGYLRPEGELHPGSGRTRWLDHHEVQVCLRMAALVRAKVEPAQAARIARQMVANHQDVCHVNPEVTLTYRPPAIERKEAS